MQSASDALLDRGAPCDTWPVDSGLGGSGVQMDSEPRVPGALFACDEAPHLVARRWGVKPLRPRSMQAALRLVTSPDYDVRCAIVRPEFHRGGGVLLVAQLRELRPLLPVMLQVEKADRTLLSLAYCHGLELAVGQDQPEKVRTFVESSLLRPRTTMERLESRVAHFARCHALTPREKRIAAAAVIGMSRADFLVSFQVSVNTLKSQTRSMLKKTGHASLNELSRDVLTGLLADAS